MKISLILILITVFNGYASDIFSQNTRMAVDMQNVTVKEVISEIENREGINFLYNDNLEDIHKYTVSYMDQPVKLVLEGARSQANMTYEEINDDFLVLLSNTESIIKQQEITITGSVTDAQTGEALPGTSVVVKGTTIGTIADIDGKYTLTVPGPDAVLVFSFVGYLSKEIVVGEQTLLNVTLNEDVLGLEEVVVVGYGTQSRQMLTTSISTVSSAAMENIPVSSIGAAIQGKVAGVNIYSGNFAPGDTPNIRVRGGSSIQKSNAPLIIVDGLPRSMDDINPNDIESIDILKDAAATSVYGARASNGVVLITTKRGSRNQTPEITFRSDLSQGSTHGYHPLVSAREFINLIRTNAPGSPFEYTIYQDGPASHVNDDNSVFTPRWLEDGESVPSGWESMDDPLYPGKTIIFQENDPVDLLFQDGLRQNYYLGVTGGAENIRYSGSLGFTDDEGTIIETQWKRLSGTSNVDIDVTDKILFSAGVDYTQTENKTEPNWANSTYRQLIMAPTWRIKYDDGTPVPGFNANATPPPYWRETRDYLEFKNRLGLNTSLTFRPVEELTLWANAFYHRNEFENEYFEKSHFFTQARNAYVNQNLGESRQFEATATYTKTFALDHNFSLMAGVSDLFIKQRNLALRADGAATDNIPTLNAAPNLRTASSSKSEESLIGMFSRLVYNYSGKYLLQGSIRRDGSSKFGAGNKWAVFPAISAGWIISQEPFMDAVNSISNLKFRASYGLTGNNAVGRYTAQGAYSVVRYASLSGIRPTLMPNENLRWEKTTQFDIGFDIGLFNQRVTLLADYYDKVTEDLLFSQPLPNTSGFSSIETNIGSVRFYGVDLDLNVNILNSSDIKWDANFIYSLNKNVVLKLPPSDRDKNRVGGYVVPDGEDFGGIAEGESLYAILGYKVDYIIDNQAQADNAHFDQLARGISVADGTEVPGRKFPGDYEWVDRNGDGVINEYDQFVLGYSMPHTTGGIGSSVSWKGFSFNIFMDYALGHSQMDRFWSHSNGNAFIARTRPTSYYITDAWEKEGDAATALLPKFVLQDQGMQSNIYRPNDRRMWSLDNICLREIRLGYDIPANLINAAGFKKVHIYVAGNTLYYFTKDPLARGTNPEYGAGGPGLYGSGFGYPPVRRITLGFNLTL